MPTREEIEEIRARIDIVELIARYVAVRPSGKNYLAICPFHPDKTPSLVISREKGLFHCFGCGAGGDAFKFLMLIENVEFPEAVRRLAEEAGVALQSAPGEPRDDLGRLRELLERVARYWEKALHEPAGRRALDYLTGARKLTPETIRRFRLGYAPPDPEDLLKAFPEPEARDDLARLGLLLETKGFFRDRVIFPIAGVQGEVAGFAGRTLGDEEPKYLNTRGTPLFSKRRLLYGLAQARVGFARFGEALLVEGYLDVITAHQHGFTHAVASMGTAFTPEQARLLRRFVPRVVLAYDRDTAGRAATLRGMQQLLAAGLEVRVVLLPPGQDPDSLLQAEGPQALQDLLVQALPFHQFYVNALLEEHDAESFQGRERILQEARAFLQGLTSPALRAQILKELSGSLDIPLEDLAAGMKGRNATVIMGGEAPVPSRKWGVEEHLMALLLQGAVPIERAMQDLAPTDFQRFSRAIEVLFSLYRDRSPSDRPERFEGPKGRRLFEEWLAQLPPDDQAALRELAISDARDEDGERAALQLIGRLRLQSLERRLQALQRELQGAERARDRTQVERLLQDQQMCFRERQKLLRELGWGTFAPQGGGGSNDG
jgi:DNA primase